jgi:hypothetical protein
VSFIFYFVNRSRSKFKFEFESKEFKFLKDLNNGKIMVEAKSANASLLSRAAQPLAPPAGATDQSDRQARTHKANPI